MKRREAAMGLDNSIEVKRNEYTNSIPEMQQFNYDWDKERKYNFEIAYWRKCWNVRTAIMHVLPSFNDNWNTGPLTTADLDAIIATLETFNEENWDEDYYGSIWEWDEYETHFHAQIERIKALRKLMDKYDLEVVFVDSY
jgi:hypothetical protein